MLLCSVIIGITVLTVSVIFDKFVSDWKDSIFAKNKFVAQMHEGFSRTTVVD